MLDMRHQAVRYRLGLLNSDSLRLIADTLLEEAPHTPAVLKLAIQDWKTVWWATVQELFEDVCEELSVEIPSLEEAISELSRYHIESIASGAETPQAGLRNVMNDIYPHISSEPGFGDSRGLRDFIRGYWQFEELVDGEMLFEGKGGTEATALWEDYIRQLAREWLQKYGNP